MITRVCLTYTGFSGSFFLFSTPLHSVSFHIGIYRSKLTFFSGIELGCFSLESCPTLWNAGNMYGGATPTPGTRLVPSQNWGYSTIHFLMFGWLVVLGWGVRWDKLWIECIKGEIILTRVECAVISMLGTCAWFRRIRPTFRKRNTTEQL